ncbi:Hypothetical protein I595_1993 [Croceitalea dokdonensis DOKDO 023]|uniref:Uncharacterized protein n=1 Tax=Croceitalea dokdonensis DOKDO 023 TaxID=1300341 RepID=A0A0P7B0B2_9FLAO|nr:Hypothetical protein I595_1993 [Croceitalea dokdonensis DOKDO 023]
MIDADKTIHHLKCYRNQWLFNRFLKPKKPKKKEWQQLQVVGKFRKCPKSPKSKKRKLLIGF